MKKKKQKLTFCTEVLILLKKSSCLSQNVLTKFSNRIVSFTLSCCRVCFSDVYSQEDEWCYSLIFFFVVWGAASQSGQNLRCPLSQQEKKWKSIVLCSEQKHKTCGNRALGGMCFLGSSQLNRKCPFAAMQGYWNWGGNRITGSIIEPQDGLDWKGP